MGAVIFIVGLFFITMFGAAIPGYSQTPVSPSPPYFCYLMEGSCTTNRQIHYKTNAYIVYIRNPQRQYRVSESSNFSGASWIPLNSTDPIPFNLSASYGTRTVFFQIRVELRNSWHIAEDRKDTIRYVQDCADATFGSPVDVTISRLNQPFSFDIGSSFSVRKIGNPTQFEINLQAMGRRTRQLILLAQKTIPYPAGSGTGDSIPSGMNLTIPVPVSTQGGIPAFSDISLIFKIQPRPGVTNAYDYDPNNNTFQKNLQLVKRTANRPHVVDKCTGPEGSSGPISPPPHAIQGWVSGQSTLTLYDCGTTEGEEIKCDINPLPAVGGRGIKWTRRPATGSSYGVHWWCEGFANKEDNSVYKYYFRFNVNYDVVEIRFP